MRVFSTNRPPVQGNDRVLVVGTTSDYIDWIRCRCRGKALFLTDPTVRRQAREPQPDPVEEVVCDLSDYRLALQTLEQHFSNWTLVPNGVVSFDCESMALAAVIAHKFALPYPSIQAVDNCRNKFVSKALWQRQALHTPRQCLVGSVADAVRFYQELAGPCVLKPLDGSGSELVFWCDSQADCETAFQEILNGLGCRRTNRLYRSFSAVGPAVLAEEYIQGDEFSCDFIVENGRIRIIRIARKVIAPTGPFGTVLGYLLSPSLPDAFSAKGLRQILYQSATALGLDRAMCMLDFIVRDGQVVLLELAPRPGGDCIAYMLRRCWNLDPLKLFLDFSVGRRLEFEKPSDLPTCLGLRVHAGHSGVLKKIDASALVHDARVREVHLPRKRGHLIHMPPDDYESWLLGHVIIEPDPRDGLEAQCRTFLDKIVVEIE
jgi:biotin carboxylase